MDRATRREITRRIKSARLLFTRTRARITEPRRPQPSRAELRRSTDQEARQYA